MTLHNPESIMKYGILRCCKHQLILAQLVTVMFGLSAFAHRPNPSVIPEGTMQYGKCRLLINELNVFPNSPDQFIELKKICDRKPKKIVAVNDLEKYKILVVGNDGYLTVVCKLNGPLKRTNDDFFYVLGGKDVEDRSMDIEDCHFASDSDDSREKRIPTGNEYPVAIMLVYNKRTSIIDQLDLKNVGTPAAPVWKRIEITTGGRIMENLQDMVIVTSSSPYTRCVFFDNFYDGFREGERSILRDWGQTVTSDVALSRCPLPELGIRQFYPFQPSMFMVAKRTPGQNNDCVHAARFFIEDTQPIRKRPRRDFSSTPGHECDVTTEDTLIETLNLITSPITYAHKLQHAIEEAARCAESDPAESSIEPSPTRAGSSSDVTSTTPTPDSEEITYVEEQVYTPTRVPQQNFEEQMAAAALINWPNCDHFQPADLILKLKSPGTQLLDWKDIMQTDTCNWFEYLGLGRSINGLKSPRFRCKICHKLLAQGIIVDRPRSRWITKLMKTAQGVGGTCAKQDNRWIIKTHKENPLHKIGLVFLELLDQGLRGDDLMSKFKEKGGLYQKFLESTENLFTATFQAVRLDITFFKFRILRELLQHFGVNVGHLYANPGGMKLITASISETMHENYVEYLKTEEPELALLVDLSTDISTLPAAAFVFQTLDNKGQLKLSLYRISHLPGETAQEIYQAFMDEIQKDGLQHYLRRKLVGYASDSGSNVLKFRELLQRVVDQELMKTQCQAHRLENAHKSAWKSEPFLLHVDHVVNDVYRIFHRSGKKKRILVLQQNVMGDSAFEVKKYHKIRWVASKKRALESLLKHWPTIVNALDEISNDMTFERDQRDDALKTSMDLKNATFLATLAFATDIFDVMSPYSLGLQYRGTTLIGKKFTRETVLSKLENLRTRNGRYLQEVLEHGVPLRNTPEQGATTLEDFENTEMKFHRIELKKPESETNQESGVPTLYNKRNDYIGKLVGEIRNRFPEDPNDGFDIFDALLWPDVVDDLILYGNTRLRRMNRKLLWNYHSENLLPEWRNLKTNIAQHPEFERRRRDLPEEFWSFFLSPDSGVEWPDSMKTIIKNIVATPASTAEVERIFSFYTSTKTVKRYRLDVSTVDDIIRIKFNGPKDISHFKAIDFVPNFLKKHARSDDDTIPATRKSLRAENADLDDDDEPTNEPDDVPMDELIDVPMDELIEDSI